MNIQSIAKKKEPIRKMASQKQNLAKFGDFLWTAKFRPLDEESAVYSH
jgi:hypothetical protein